MEVSATYLWLPSMDLIYAWQVVCLGSLLRVLVTCTALTSSWRTALFRSCVVFAASHVHMELALREPHGWDPALCVFVTSSTAATSMIILVVLRKLSNLYPRRETTLARGRTQLDQHERVGGPLDNFQSNSMWRKATQLSFLATQRFPAVPIHCVAGSAGHAPRCHPFCRFP